MHGRMYYRGMGRCHPRVRRDLDHEPCQSSISPWGWGFFTLRGVFDLGDVRFRFRFVGFVDERKDLRCKDGASLPPGAAGPRRFAEG